MLGVAALNYVWAFAIVAASVAVAGVVVIRMDREGERSVGHQREQSARQDLRGRVRQYLGPASSKGRPVTLIVVILLLALNLAGLLGYLNVW